MKLRMFLAAAVVGGLCLVSGYGQLESIRATIDFPFIAAGKTLPAGQYEFSRDTRTLVIHVQGEGADAALVPVLTLLAGAIHTTPEDAHIVFDKVGDTYILSELWLRGEDGFLLALTEGPHEHKVIDVKY
jgi:hypothetical protein